MADIVDGNRRGLSDTEQKLLLIWMDILQRTDIGIDDDFIDLGGDSLSAMLCASRIRNAFNVDLTIEDFLIQPATVAHLAANIDQARIEPSGSASVDGQVS